MSIRNKPINAIIVKVTLIVTDSHIKEHHRCFGLGGYFMASVFAAASYYRIGFSLCLAVCVRCVRVPGGSVFYLEPGIITIIFYNIRCTWFTGLLACEFSWHIDRIDIEIIYQINEVSFKFPFILKWDFQRTWVSGYKFVI